ncbi:MAG: YceI family protein [Niabella sp.]|nr:YceI family protein [Niabella sp.]
MKRTSFLLALLLLGTTVSLNAQVLKPVDAESKVAFVARNMGMDVNGAFSGLKGTITINKAAPDKSSFDVTVDVATIKTGIDKRDAHLKTADFFDAAKYPQIRIQSKRILPKSGDIYYAEATLTLHGISKEIKFDFIAKPVSGGYKLTAGFPLIRQDYSIGGSSMTLSDKVNIVLAVVAK